MKKIFTLLVVALASITNLLAYDFEVGGLYYNYGGRDEDGNYHYSDEGVFFNMDDNNWNGYTGNVTIPSNVTYNGQGYDVIGISSEAFSSSYNITSIYIPSTIKYLDGNPFRNIDNSSITITISPDNQKIMAQDYGIYSKDMKILYWLYKEFGWYEDRILNIPAPVEEIKEGALHGNADQIVLTENIKKIGSNAFSYVYNVSSLKYNGTLEHYMQIEFGDNALSGSIPAIYIQDELLKDLVIPASITSIPAQMFYSVDSIQSITIPTSVTSIGHDAFTGTKYFDVANNWEDGVLYIGDCLIRVKDTCKHVVIKEGTRLIADEAFCHSYGRWWTNSNLVSITMPNSLQTIGNYAFSRCSSLSDITFSTGITFLGNDVFYGSGYDLNDDSKYDADGVLYLGNILYKAKSNIIKGDYQVKSGTTLIMGSAFANCNNLTSITISNSVNSIGNESFYNCHGLKSLSLGNGVTSIGERAFYFCDSLENVSISNSVTSIGNSAFNYCSSLATLTIGENLTNLNDNVFANCPNLTSVIWNAKNCADISISEDVWDGKSPFEYSNNITSFTFGDNVEYIPACLCYGFGNITSISIPDKAISVGERAFYSCSALNQITIGKRVKSFGNKVFGGCRKIKYVNWNAIHADNIDPVYNWRSEYGNGLFNTISGYYDAISSNPVESIVFGDEVEYIPSYLCYHLDQLKSVTIPVSVKSIGYNAFEGCSNLVRVNTSDIAAWASIKIDNANGNPLFVGANLYLNGEIVTNVIIPDGTTTIGKNSFNNCKNLNSVTIPNSVTSIGESAFNGCNDVLFYIESNVPATINNSFSSTAYLLVNDTTPYKTAWSEYKSQIFLRSKAIQTIDASANASLSSIHKTIGDADLENVVDLTVTGTINSFDLMIMRNKMINLRFLDLTGASVVANTYQYYQGYSTSNNTLRNHSFKNLVSLKLPSSLILADSVVSDCPNLRYLEINGGKVISTMVPSDNLTVVLNEGVTEISSTAFAGKSGLKSISIPASLKSIADKTFYDCRGLQSVSIAEGIISIGTSAFNGCYKLSKLNLPEGLQTIGTHAFRGIGVNEVMIPSTVTSIGDYAFCSNYGTGAYTYAPIHYYYSGSTISSDGYSASCRTGNVRFAQNSKLKSIGSYAFYGCKIDSLVVPDSVKTIGTYAFAYCDKLKSVYFSNKSEISRIPNGTFQNCPSIQTLQLPSSLETIDELAFSLSNYSAKDSLDITLPEKVVKLNRGAFYGRNNICRISFADKLKTIGQDAFNGCISLKTLSFPTSLQTIGNKAFQNCTSLKELRVPSTLLSVGDYAFSGCDQVKKVYTYTVEPVSINQNTFSCWHSADLYVPTTSYYTYYYNTQWSQFLSLKEFDEEYTYFYINNDYELDNSTGAIDGKPDADLNPGSGLIISGDSVQQAGTITVNDNPTSGAASILACEETLLADTLNIRLVTQKGKWSYFCFPFDLLFDQLHYAHQYVFRYYNGQTRAEYGSGGWANVIGGMLQKGIGYIFQGAKTDTLQITVPNPRFDCHDFTSAIKSYSATYSVDAHWNFIGNPYPSWYDLDALFTLGFRSPVYTWNGVDYDVYTPGDDEYHFHPYEGFFLQNMYDHDASMTWDSDGRETKTQADDKRGQGRHIMHRGQYIPRREAVRRTRQAEEHRYLINLSLASEDYTDRTRIVFNEAAKADYEPGKDAVKMTGGTAPLHIWSQTDEARYSVNERPFGDNRVSLGYNVSEDGFYTLSAGRMDTLAIIYDNVLQQEVDLTQGDYMFYTEAGTNTTRFAIIRVQATQNVVTDINEQLTNANTDEFVSVYTMLGVKLCDHVRLSQINLPEGVYVIEGENGATKHMTIGK